MWCPAGAAAAIYIYKTNVLLFFAILTIISAQTGLCTRTKMTRKKNNRISASIKDMAETIYLKSSVLFLFKLNSVVLFIHYLLAVDVLRPYNKHSHIYDVYMRADMAHI